jgi:hypothetical protein
MIKGAPTSQNVAMTKDARTRKLKNVKTPVAQQESTSLQIRREERFASRINGIA